MKSYVIREDETQVRYTINGLTVLPRYSFKTREQWYDHLLSLNHDKISKAIGILRRRPNTSSIYDYLSDYLYEALLIKIPDYSDNESPAIDKD